MDKPIMRLYSDLDALVRDAAEEVVRFIKASEQSPITIVLAGGSTPKPLYRLLADEYAGQISWDTIHLFWGDERYVPHDSPQSNYLMARTALIERIPIPEANVHPMPTYFDDANVAAADYEATIQAYFADQPPVFDIVLLGMGHDGHTASLFPGSPVLDECEHLVVATTAPIEPHTRLTLTLPVINNARKIMMLVGGSDKHDVLKQIRTNQRSAAERYPAARLRTLEWYVVRG